VEEYYRVVADLRQAYGPTAAAARDGQEKEAFKVDARRHFRELLRDRGATSLLEVGAGTGHDSLYFQGEGLRVLCTDLSPAMVELCQAKDLDARVADFLGLGVPTSVTVLPDGHGAALPGCRHRRGSPKQPRRCGQFRRVSPWPI